MGHLGPVAVGSGEAGKDWIHTTLGCTSSSRFVGSRDLQDSIADTRSPNALDPQPPVVCLTVPAGGATLSHCGLSCRLSP